MTGDDPSLGHQHLHVQLSFPCAGACGYLQLGTALELQVFDFPFTFPPLLRPNMIVVVVEYDFFFTFPPLLRPNMIVVDPMFAL